MNAIAHPPRQVVYGLDDRPPPLRAVFLAAQHVLTMFGSTVAVPLLFGPELWPVPPRLPAELSARLQEMQLSYTAVLISSVMLCSGVATLLQTTFGSRLPIVQGVSFSFIAAFLGIVAATQMEADIDWQAATAAGGAGLEAAVSDWQKAGAAGMQSIAGAVIAGAVFEIAVGFSGLIGAVRRYLSPVVIGPVITLIGLALYQVGAPVAASHWPISLLTIAGVIFFSLVLSRRSRFFQLFPMLSAILLSIAVCGIGTAAGWFTPQSAAHLNLSTVERAEWLRFGSVFFPWGLPQFGLAALIAVLAGYLASILESFGDYHACKNLAGGGDPTPQEISRGIAWEGVACGLTGTLGGFSSTSYSENVGLVGLTKVGSRHVVQIGGVILIVLGLVGKFGACAAAIPRPVVGGLYCVLFGLIAAVGVRQFAKADLSSDRNLLIGGLALFLGLSVPFYFGEFGGGRDDLAAVPEAFRGLIIAVGTTGMAVAAIVGLMLDNLIPGTDAERGLEVSSNGGVEAAEVADV